nr:immunoglobulin heavy chain junction region [Mus musculus]MBK4184872.1 immunoglobulin heavy chain junction region [Mus musculus]MBK4184873.1 immunoglobulin heavy chain junction region [Mus musculus]
CARELGRYWYFDVW